MNTIKVEFDFERDKKIFKKYFKYEWKRGTKYYPNHIILCSAIFFLFLGYFLENFFVSFLGGIMLFLALCFWGFHFLRYQFQIKGFLNQLKNNKKSPFVFKFDEDNIEFSSEEFNTKLKWNYIKNYEENNGDVYLFHERRELINIISELIIGKEFYKEFLMILKQKVQKGKE